MENKLVTLINMERSTLGKLEIAKQLKDYFSKDGCRFNEAFVDFGRLVGGLASWIDSSSFQVAVAAMEILGLIVHGMQKDFYFYLHIIVGPLINKLGDNKKQLREVSQVLIQQVMDYCMEHPQHLLDRLMDGCVDKNWHMKEQVLICLVRTLKVFGKEPLPMAKYIDTVCTLMKDADGKVRKVAMDALVNIYLCVGEELLVHLSKNDAHKPQIKLLLENLTDVNFHRNNYLKPDDQYGISNSVFSGESDRGMTSDSSSSKAARIVSNASVKKRDMDVSRRACPDPCRTTLPMARSEMSHNLLLSNNTIGNSSTVNRLKTGIVKRTRIDSHSVKSYKPVPRTTAARYSNSGSMSSSKSPTARTLDSTSVRSKSVSLPQTSRNIREPFNCTPGRGYKPRPPNVNANTFNSTRLKINNESRSQSGHTMPPKYFASNKSESRTGATNSSNPYPGGTFQMEPESSSAKYFDSSSGSNSKSRRSQSLSLGSAATTTTSANVESGRSQGSLTEMDFIKIFNDVEEQWIHTKYEIEMKLREVSEILQNAKNKWDVKVVALQDFRKLVHCNQIVMSREDYANLMKVMIDGTVMSLKDRRSQVIKEACVTISYISTSLGHHAALFGASMLPLLIPLLSNSTKIITSSGDVCVKFIIKNSLSLPLLQTLENEGFSHKSSQIRRYCAGFLESCIDHVKSIHSPEGPPLIESLLTCAIHDFDSTSKTLGRRAFWKYQAHFPHKANQFLEALSQKDQKYIHAENPSNQIPLGNGRMIQSPTVYENEGVERYSTKPKQTKDSPASRCFNVQKEDSYSNCQTSYKESNHDSISERNCMDDKTRATDQLFGADFALNDRKLYTDSNYGKMSTTMQALRFQGGDSWNTSMHEEIQHTNIGVQSSLTYLEATDLESVVKETIEQVLKFQQGNLSSASSNKAECQRESSIQAYVTKILLEKQPSSQFEFICDEPNNSSLQPGDGNLNEAEDNPASSNIGLPLHCVGQQKEPLSTQKETAAAEEHTQEFQHSAELLPESNPAPSTREQKTAFEVEELEVISSTSELSLGQDILMPTPLPISSSAFEDDPAHDSTDVLNDLILPPPYPFNLPAEEHLSDTEENFLSTVMDDTDVPRELLLSQVIVGINDGSAKEDLHSSPPCNASPNTEELPLHAASVSSLERCLSQALPQ